MRDKKWASELVTSAIMLTQVHMGLKFIFGIQTKRIFIENASSHGLEVYIWNSSRKFFYRKILYNVFRKRLLTE